MRQPNSNRNTKTIGNAKKVDPHIKYFKQKIMKKEGLTIKEHGIALKAYQRFYRDGVTIKNALALSLDADFIKMKEDIKIVGLSANRNGQLIFTTEASKRNLDNKYGVAKTTKAKKHIVHIEFDKKQLDDALELEALTPYEIMSNTKISYQCSCGRHTFYYRYLWTLIGSSIGLQEKRFPRIRNKYLKGMLCKHGIRVVLFMQTERFMGEWGRYLNAREKKLTFRTKNPFNLK